MSVVMAVRRANLAMARIRRWQRTLDDMSNIAFRNGWGDWTHTRDAQHVIRNLARAHADFARAQQEMYFAWEVRQRDHVQS